ncbi:hypothetical protein PTRG_11746 [Pyrenophora tritici-repentis Pt-1C-BFP]|uniref:Uncharacterized protein n=1 Tax=Pyrenophora tritici-repentis (strain Pt-1C-BFP) TaxID=426418 RepID=B2WP36_PYRTR|nr:uncharacterized protein PTRG_11746 [Pyrenophora tritici-repentis Pt-1C-BFP]EDU44796.1 hypothetical protein PTRG_11746 [Pyrenophora tritici-repentis Pt-1C-BFP]
MAHWKQTAAEPRLLSDALILANEMEAAKQLHKCRVEAVDQRLYCYLLLCCDVCVQELSAQSPSFPPIEGLA